MRKGVAQGLGAGSPTPSFPMARRKGQPGAVLGHPLKFFGVGSASPRLLFEKLHVR